jgi:hypothetical protein
MIPIARREVLWAPRQHFTELFVGHPHIHLVPT